MPENIREFIKIFGIISWAENGNNHAQACTGFARPYASTSHIIILYMAG
jgi:hypothetical protein